MTTARTRPSPARHPGSCPAAGGAASVDRALAVLRTVAGADAPASLAALAAETGFYKSTILRLAASLQAGGLLVRRSDGRFGLGPAFLALGARYQQQAASAEVLMPTMRDLARQSGESVAFYVRAGSVRICLYRVDSPQALRYSVQVGAQLPLDRGSGGRVLAAFGGDAGALHAAICARGYHHSDGERDPDVAGLSAPVFRTGNELVGALTIAGPRQRLTPSRAIELLPALLAAAASATRSFGGAGLADLSGEGFIA